MSFGYYDWQWVDPDPEPEYEPEWEDCFIIEETFHKSGNVYREFLTAEEAEEWRKSYLEDDDEGDYDPCTVKCWSGYYEVDGCEWGKEELVWELVFD